MPAHSGARSASTAAIAHLIQHRPPFERLIYRPMVTTHAVPCGRLDEQASYLSKSDSPRPHLPTFTSMRLNAPSALEHTFHLGHLLTPKASVLPASRISLRQVAVARCRRLFAYSIRGVCPSDVGLRRDTWTREVQRLLELIGAKLNVCSSAEGALSRIESERWVRCGLGESDLER